MMLFMAVNAAFIRTLLRPTANEIVGGGRRCNYHNNTGMQYKS
jgi:hypothetical protein